jgi:class I fructose-bisphosphate aldolase
MLANQINKLLTDGRTLILAYDQGLEHGPSADFNIQNVDPGFILDIAEKGKYNAIALHHGVAEKYYPTMRSKIPLIVKLNGKTNITKIEPIAGRVCSIKRAVSIGAEAVGYTIYVGSTHEKEIFEEFGHIVEEAHDYSIPVIAWIYPRGQFVKDEFATETLAHSARVGLELGADFIKIKYNNDPEAFKWVVKSAGRARVVVAGGDKMGDREFLQKTSEILQAGSIGLAVGRNVWQHANPTGMTEALKKIIFENKSVDEALQQLEKR